MLPKGVVFVVFCFVLRVVMAFGGAAADTSSFAIVAGEFGTNIGTVTVRVTKFHVVVMIYNSHSCALTVSSLQTVKSSNQGKFLWCKSGCKSDFCYACHKVTVDVSPSNSVWWHLARTLIVFPRQLKYTLHV